MMIKTKYILVVGRHPQIMETVIRLINKDPTLHAIGCLQNEAAMGSFKKVDFDMVLYSSGIEASCEALLTRFFRSIKPQVPIIQHYGGGSGLLYAEIREALHK